MSTSSSNNASSPAILERIGRYRIVRPLSKGGMALVYEGRRESLAGVAPRVAIKVILPEHAGSEAFRDLFINEARLGARMQHQNLVQIQDFDQDGDKYFLVMEYVEGLTLRRISSLCTRHGISIPLNVVAELGRQACDGLEFAHCAVDENGRPLRLVHRDVKPSNLILSPQGTIKLLDFGISKGILMEERAGSVKGTWGYMAPEQALGQEVGPYTDVFGLATVLYEMASLTPLFRKKKQAEIKRLLQDDHAVRMVATLDDSYQNIVPVFMKALSVEPRARYQTAGRFATALSAILPDPVTVREEMVRFYAIMDALEQGKDDEVIGRLKDIDSKEILDASSPAWQHPAKSTTQATTIGWLSLGALVLAIFIALTAQWLNKPESESNLDFGERVAPLSAVTPTDPLQEPAVVTVDRSVKEQPTNPEPTHEKPQAPAGLLSIKVYPVGLQYEIFIDGQFVKQGNQQDLPVDIGKHTVTVTTTDGRQKRFDVDVEEGVTLRRYWDFDRNRWRK